MLAGLAGRHRTLDSLPRRLFLVGFRGTILSAALGFSLFCPPNCCVLPVPFLFPHSQFLSLSFFFLTRSSREDKKKSTMTPSPSEAVAKVAQAASGTNSSAKAVKRESNTARVLGAGMSFL